VQQGHLRANVKFQAISADDGGFLRDWYTEFAVYVRSGFFH